MTTFLGQSWGRVSGMRSPRLVSPIVTVNTVSRENASGGVVPSVGGSPGGSWLGREQVAGIQRARILVAMVDVVTEYGVGNVTVTSIVGRSGVSRRTFYELFDDRDDCFLAAFDDAVARVTERVIPVFKGSGRWRERIRAGLVALLELFDEERGLARLLVVESLAAGPAALARRARVLEGLTSVVDDGRCEGGKAGQEIPVLAGEGVVGAVLAVIHARLISGESRRLVELTGPLMGMIVLPYLGAAAAQREIQRPLPKRETGRRRGSRDPLRELNMRLTYRTVRVLIAVAANPASSNRTVGSAAGIADQGQISKLLARLDGLGLVENGGPGSTRGEPNAWSLTTKGQAVHEAIVRPSTASTRPATASAGASSNGR
jgi:AcrR family transcriptional regulator